MASKTEQFSEHFRGTLQRALARRGAGHSQAQLKKQILDNLSHIRADPTIGNATAMSAAEPGSQFYICDHVWGIVYRLENQGQHINFQILHPYAL